VASKVVVVARFASGALHDSELVPAEAMGTHNEPNCRNWKINDFLN